MTVDSASSLRCVAALALSSFQKTNGYGRSEEHRLAFKDFVPTFRGRILTDVPPLNPTKATSVGLLISDQQEGPFKLEVAWIKAAPRSGN